MQHKPVIVLNQNKIISGSSGYSASRMYMALHESGYHVIDIDDADAPAAVILNSSSSFWDQAFLAALTGTCSDPEATKPDSIVSFAKDVADKADAARDTHFKKEQS